MVNLFSKKAEKLLRDEMCICLDDLQSHLISTAPTKLEFFREFFDFLTELNPPRKYVELEIEEYPENNEFLETEISNFSDTRGIEISTEEYLTLDSISHAFISFKSLGLNHLYKHQEPENWYPKIVIRRKLNVHNLADEVEIYRGACKSEFETREFRQSWTLNEQVARDFAFKIYDSQEAYIGTKRMVLKARINARDIYYYDETDNEQEVIIDEREIISIPIVIDEGFLQG